MNWRVLVRPEVEHDVAEAAAWYDSQQAGLGGEFREEVIQVLDALVANPLLHSRRHPRKDIRWRYPDRFPYRVIYEVWATFQPVPPQHCAGGSLAPRDWKVP